MSASRSLLFKALCDRLHVFKKFLLLIRPGELLDVAERVDHLPLPDAWRGRLQLVKGLLRRTGYGNVGLFLTLKSHVGLRGLPGGAEGIRTSDLRSGGARGDGAAGSKA